MKIFVTIGASTDRGGDIARAMFIVSWHRVSRVSPLKKSLPDGRNTWGGPTSAHNIEGEAVLVFQSDVKPGGRVFFTRSA